MWLLVLLVQAAFGVPGGRRRGRDRRPLLFKERPRVVPELPARRRRRGKIGRRRGAGEHGTLNISFPMAAAEGVEFRQMNVKRACSLLSSWAACNGKDSRVEFLKKIDSKPGLASPRAFARGARDLYSDAHGHEFT